MNILRMIPFAIWMFQNLRVISKYKNRIEQTRASGDHEAERAAILGATSTWGTSVAKKIGLNIKIEGNRDLPKGPVVFVSNHQGYADILAFCIAIRDKQFGFIAKDNLSKIPLFGEWIRRVRSVFLNRDDARASLKAIDEGVSFLKEGFSLGIFPEGTRSKGDHMGEFKKGSMRLATKAGVPVIPITLSGTWHVFEEKGHIQPAEVYIYFHDPIMTAGMDRAAANGLTADVEKIIRGKLDEYNKKI